MPQPGGPLEAHVSSRPTPSIAALKAAGPLLRPRERPALTSVCCSIPSHRTRETHPELCFKCKHAAAWSFPVDVSLLALTQVQMILTLKQVITENPLPCFLLQQLSYIFCISDPVLFVTSSFTWPLQISSYRYFVFFPGDW